MRLREHDTLEGLVSDLRGVSKRAPQDIRDVVRDGVRAGNILAQDSARISAGRHGRLYPRSMSAEMHPGAGLFGNVVSGEYGPDINKPQGGMSFERGSRNQKPHLDLARSADRIVPSFQREAGGLADRWFGKDFGGQRGRLF